MKNCRPNSWWVKLIDRVFGIKFTCDHRCEYHYDAPCMFDENGKKR